MSARFAIIKPTAVLGLLLSQAIAAGAAAQDFSKLQCPTLIELRIAVLVQYGYCPRDRFFAKRYARQAAGCDPSLSDRDAEQRVLDDPRTSEDRETYQAIVSELERKRCDF